MLGLVTQVRGSVCPMQLVFCKRLYRWVEGVAWLVSHFKVCFAKKHVFRSIFKMYKKAHEQVEVDIQEDN